MFPCVIRESEPRLKDRERGGIERCPLRVSAEWVVDAWVVRHAGQHLRAALRPRRVQDSSRIVRVLGGEQRHFRNSIRRDLVVGQRHGRLRVADVLDRRVREVGAQVRGERSRIVERGDGLASVGYPHGADEAQVGGGEGSPVYGYARIRLSVGGERALIGSRGPRTT